MNSTIKKVLIIEDHPQMRRNIAMILQRENFVVEIAENGRAGVEKARAGIPDIVLCDIMMPELDGHGVLQELRADPDTAEIPFIFLTARSERNDQRAGMNSGADDYLTKPVTRDELLAAIHARLRRRDVLEQQLKARLSKIAPDFHNLAPLEALGVSPREAEVLGWVAQGKSNAEIASILRMSEHTVKKHLQHVFDKLGVESRHAAALRALEVLSG
jgi:DNA-binding NarL/FixJ family response regulator